MNTFLIHDVAVVGIHYFFLLIMFKIVCSQNVGSTLLLLTNEFLLPLLLMLLDILCVDNCYICVFVQPSRSTSTLNTPVVALQTPSIPGLGGYPGSLSAFGGQDFSVGSEMGLGTLSWSHQLPTSLAHTR